MRRFLRVDAVGLEQILTVGAVGHAFEQERHHCRALGLGDVGNKVARKEIAMIKVAAPNMAQQVIDWAIQVHGAAGVSDDFFLARAYAGTRTLRLADGPDEVHRNQIGQLELREH